MKLESFPKPFLQVPHDHSSGRSVCQVFFSFHQTQHCLVESYFLNLAFSLIYLYRDISIYIINDCFSVNL
uniref:Uncharacterized protein n=1 Tax=Octopus bimaculoides TaxID=37653 RepID=A0A0L8HZE2_OCTBM